MTQNDKAAFDAEWNKRTPDEQREWAFTWWCEVIQRRNQMAGRINEGNAEFWEAKNSQLESQRQRSHGGRVRAANDPKHAALREVRKEWEGWRHKKAYKTAFAMDMIAKYPILKSAENIARKCREWEKEYAVESRSQLADSGTS